MLQLDREVAQAVPVVGVVADQIDGMASEQVVVSYDAVEVRNCVNAELIVTEVSTPLAV